MCLLIFITTDYKNLLVLADFTLDAAIGTEPWIAITLSTRFLDMEIVHPQRPACPPPPASPTLFVFLILPGKGVVGVGLATGHTFLTLATPDPNVT